MTNALKIMLANGAKLFRWAVYPLLLGAMSLTAAEAFTAPLSIFHFTRQAFLPPEAVAQAASSGCAIELDELFFGNISDPANDLRIVSDRGKEIPFVLKKVLRPALVLRDVQLNGKIIRNQQLPDQRNVVDFELEADSAAVSAVELVGKGLPAGSLLTIAVGSGSNFVTAVDKFVLSDTTLLPEVVNRRFPLPRKLTGKIVRLTLEKGQFTNLEAVRVYTQTGELHPNTAASKKFNIQEIDRKVSAEAVKIVYNVKFMPLTQLVINSSNQRYLRKVTLYSSSDRRKWEPVTSGTIRKFDLDTANTLDFPENKSKYLLLQIENVNGAELKDLQISAVGTVYQWWLPAGKISDSLTIYYGAESAVPANTYQPEELPQPEITLHLAAPRPNKLHKTGVRDRGSWQHLAGAVIVILAFFAVVGALINNKRSNKILPAD
ncbi:MAG: hypothetical protein IKA65_01235 [Lentisphaeria bacterium]|nr:hypothetical protein [Lentisphaeria bacterium]